MHGQSPGVLVANDQVEFVFHNVKYYFFNITSTYVGNKGISKNVPDFTIVKFIL